MKGMQLLMASEAAAAIGLDEKTKIVGEFDVDLVLHVHQKSKEHASMAACAYAHFDALTKRLKELGGDEVVLPVAPQSWGPRPKADPQRVLAKQTAAKAARSSSYKGECDRRGFRIGATVALKASPNKNAQGQTIASISEDTVTLASGTEVRTVVMLDDYVVTAAPPEAEKRIYFL